ncbi:CBS domain-containing protein [Natroniella sulfidigena]|uniref:CBS domain-containing protein n=1 Tax=Natroniella sulfidigena TaxID=723921 RepID=UPI00200AA9D7|nr:CBS domain-containing protein [Natroniella sulfidigena]MCK8816252.1 CBS domain-containing protein [Natroniella sulfidigena]
MDLRQVMTSDVSTVEPNAPVSEAAQKMRELNVGAIPVSNGQEPVGIVTDRDITIRNVAENHDGNTAVEQVMSSGLVYGSPDMTTQEAANLMAENQIRRLPIVENGNLVGIVSLGDISVQSEADMEAGDALSTISIPSKPQK